MVGWSESKLLVLRSSLHSLSFSLPSPLGPNEGTALLHDTAGVPSTPSPLTSADSHGTVTQTHRQADGIIRGPRAPHRERSAHQLPSPYGTHAPIPCAHNHPNDPARFPFPSPNHRTHSRHDPAARMKAIPWTQRPYTGTRPDVRSNRCCPGYRDPLPLPRPRPSVTANRGGRGEESAPQVVPTKLDSSSRSPRPTHRTDDAARLDLALLLQATACSLRHPLM